MNTGSQTGSHSGIRSDLTSLSGAAAGFDTKARVHSGARHEDKLAAPDFGSVPAASTAASPQNRAEAAPLPEALPSSLAQLSHFTPRQLGASRWLGYLPFLAWLVQEQRPSQSVVLGLGTASVASGLGSDGAIPSLGSGSAALGLGSGSAALGLGSNRTALGLNTGTPAMDLGADIPASDLGSAAAYFTLCQAAADLPPGNAALPRLYGIDQPSAAQSAAAFQSQSADEATNAAPPLSPELPEALRRANAAYARLSRLICADPLRAHRAFDPGSTDLLLVDLPLTAPLLTHLAKDWLPLMSPRGVILLCGTQPGFQSAAQTAAASRPAPEAALSAETAAALRQLLALRPHLSLPWQGGLVALMAGDLPPPALMQLAALAAKDPAQDALRDLLHRSAAPLQQQVATAAAQARILALEAELSRRQDGAVQEIAALTRLAEARRSEAETALGSAKSQLSAREAELTEAKSQLAEAQNQLSAQADELTELRGARLNDSRELAVFARLCEDHRRQAEQAAAREERLRHELTALTQHLEGTRAEVAALRSSTSWRLTAPLRRAITLLRPNRRG